MSPLQLSAYTLTTSLGAGLDANLEALRQQRSGLRPSAFETVRIDTAIGAIDAVDTLRVRADLAAFDCRNNRLAQLALEQDRFAGQTRAALAKYAPERVGVFIGTSTAGILETEIAYRQRDPENGRFLQPPPYRNAHNPYSVTDFVRRYFALAGPAATVSTACSSSAKVFATAQRMIEAGLIDAALVGGVDSLCLTTLYGFASLQLTSAQPCRPFDPARNGISIGEGAAFALLEPLSPARTDGGIALLGVGESSDAYHMSSPHPEGRGAQQAMRAALQRAGLAVDDIDYINLHGTATPSNDAAEGHAVGALFGTRVPASSTKGATGHTLGAAGAVEAVIAALALAHDFIPAGVNTQTLDETLAIDYVLANRTAPLRHVLSNSFGFGGTNCSLILGKMAA
jgi:3-oxoacyl-[acyl-carrier-protein] synthase-1